MIKSFSKPFPDVPLTPLSPDAELTPLVVESVDIVLAALEPTFSPPLLANGRSEFRISARAFWWYPDDRVDDLPDDAEFIMAINCWPMLSPAGGQPSYARGPPLHFWHAQLHSKTLRSTFRKGKHIYTYNNAISTLRH